MEGRRGKGRPRVIYEENSKENARKRGKLMEKLKRLVKEGDVCRK